MLETVKMVQTKRPRRPKRFTSRELLKVGVETFKVENSGFWFRCQECKKVWTTYLHKGGHQPRGYWKCPEGCNHP